MKRGFTLIESIVAILMLSIGFSALYYWFMGHSMLRHQEKAYVDFQRLVTQQCERVRAFPHLPEDWEPVYSWSQNGYLYEMHSQWIDSLWLDSVTDAHELSLNTRNAWLQRPQEVKLDFQQWKLLVHDDEEQKQWVRSVQILLVLPGESPP